MQACKSCDRVLRFPVAYCAVMIANRVRILFLIYATLLSGGSPVLRAESPVGEDVPPVDEGFAEIERLTYAMELIRSAYVDPEQVSYARLVDGAIAGMLGRLDPHCQFLSSGLYEDMQQTDGDSYKGVGIGVAMKNNALTIGTVKEDGPAARAGLLPGDQIVRIGEVFTERVGLLEAARMLSGEPGEELELTVRRPSSGEFLTVEMMRGVVRETTVKDPLLLPAAIVGDRKIGYLRLTQFNERSAFELERALERLEDQGIAAMVLDLRNNPGGLLDVAVKVLGLFLPPETLVVETRGRSEEFDAPPLHTAELQIRARDYPLAVLVNHGSASASELVSAALQDLRRAVIVGETTFGKGSVQSIIPAGEGAIRITTAKYYTPGGRSVHERGVQPDIVSVATPEQEEALFAWWRDERRSEDLAGGLARLQDPQLQRAADVLAGILAYGSLGGSDGKQTDALSSDESPQPSAGQAEGRAAENVQSSAQQ
jgi:carboxyl-terminal processing protease